MFFNKNDFVCFSCLELLLQIKKDSLHYFCDIILRKWLRRNQILGAVKNVIFDEFVDVYLKIDGM